MNEYREYLFLVNSDSAIEALARDGNPDITGSEIAELLAGVHRARDEHPFYVDTIDEHRPTGEFLSFSAGTNYEMAKFIASETNAHLVTDIDYRWKEIEADRDVAGIDPHRWSAFAKALQSANLRFLDHADLVAAQRLRQEHRLDGLRALFRKVWRSASREDSFSESAATDLASELTDKVGEAEAEWAKIDQDLFKWFGTEIATAGGILASGHGQFLPMAASVAGLGVANLVHAGMKRHSFSSRYPAAFFIGL